MAQPPDAAVPLFLHPAFWAIVSIVVAFGLTYLLLHRPRKWWLLIAAAVASYVLFGPFGFGGYLLGLGLKLWQNKDLPPTAPAKPESVQAHARKKRRQKPK